MVNRKKLEGILERLKDYLEKLQILASYPKENFLDDFTKVESAKHLLQVSVESCLSISHHIIASDRFRNPQSYVEAFEILSEHQILPEEFLPTLRQMVQFRNRIVHLYWEVNEGVVYEILQNNLKDFNAFMHYIINFLDSEPLENYN
jgi:uncharacterized protein YutE (UPF0331/DUF86 family)